MLEFVKELEHPKRWVIAHVTNPLCLPIKLHGLMLAPRALCPFQGGGTGDGAPLEKVKEFYIFRVVLPEIGDSSTL